MTRDRPSQHGAILGEALARIADAGAGDDLPARCRGCAFRAGSYANQSAATVSAALSCLTGADEFRCHHGLDGEGQPTQACGGYEAAKRVTVEAGLPILEEASAHLAVAGPDDLRAATDRWLAEVDPADALDDYARARLWDRRGA